LAILDPSGAFTYANEQWFFIAGVTKEKRQMHLPLLNTGAIDDIDREYYAAKWVELTTKLLPITMELRMSNPWVGDIAGSVLTIQRWMLATFSPELDDDGNLKSVMGCR
jgi:PAS domain-containing protein